MTIHFFADFASRRKMALSPDVKLSLQLPGSVNLHRYLHYMYSFSQITLTIFVLDTVPFTILMVRAFSETSMLPYAKDLESLSSKLNISRSRGEDLFSYLLLYSFKHVSIQVFQTSTTSACSQCTAIWELMISVCRRSFRFHHSF